MNVADHMAAPGAALSEMELLQRIEQQPSQLFGESNGVLPKPAPAYAALKHFPYARIDRSTIRRDRRLGPALSPSTTRRVYPDEDSTADAASQRPAFTR